MNPIVFYIAYVIILVATAAYSWHRGREEGWIAGFIQADLALDEVNAHWTEDDDTELAELVAHQPNSAWEFHKDEYEHRHNGT